MVVFSTLLKSDPPARKTLHGSVGTAKIPVCRVHSEVLQRLLGLHLDVGSREIAGLVLSAVMQQRYLGIEPQLS